MLTSLAPGSSPMPPERQAQLSPMIGQVDAALLWAVAPRFRGQMGERQRAIIDAIGPALAPVLDSYQINSPLRIAHLVAQLAHESAGFRTTEEFASGAAYEGRRDLGNIKPGDGVRFKGRGLIQLTGRANYVRFGAMLGRDLVGNPEAAAEPVLSLEIACAYWDDRALNSHADRDDLIAVTRAINGGTNGLADRRACLARAKDALARVMAASVLRATGQRGLRRRSRGAAVIRRQQALRAPGGLLAI